MPEPDSSSPALAGDTDIVVLDPSDNRVLKAEDLHEASGDAIAREFERFMRRRQDDR